MIQIFFALFGIIGIAFFYINLSFPVYASVALFIFASAALCWAYRRSYVGPLTVFLFFAYALPFIHIVPYMWFNFDGPPPENLWGLLVNPYMTDKKIVELMSMIGAVGAAGFTSGALLFPKKIPSILPDAESGPSAVQGKTLSLPVFFIWILVAVGLTWVSAPKETIFTAAYTQSKSISSSWNFSSAWMLSYGFLLFAVADSIFEPCPQARAVKLKSVVLAFAVIVIWFQLLRGDRESISCILAAALMYLFWGRKLPGGIRLKSNFIWLIAASGLLLMVVVYLFGMFRSVLADVHTWQDLRDVFTRLAQGESFHPGRLFCGTWSAALLTPLSVAGDCIRGILPIKHGQTYLDLFASVVPGFIASKIGYVRPIDGFHGPAWAMRYGIGGTHAVVVPFMEFRMAGVFFVIALWSFLFAKIENYAHKPLTPSSLALLGIVASAVPHWLWYGEKNIMNALIIWLILSLVYRIRLIGSTENRSVPSQGT